MASEQGAVIEVRVPDIGDFEDVEIVEILVAQGDRVEIEDSLVTLESDKATMEIPSPVAGVVEALGVGLGDRVSEGAVLLTLRVAAAEAEEPEVEPAAPAAAEKTPEAPAAPQADAPSDRPASAPAPASDSMAPARSDLDAPARAAADAAAGSTSHASPLVRRAARELGVDLARTRGSGEHGRVLESDVKAYVRDTLGQAGGAERGAAGPAPTVDWSRYGPVRSVPLGKIRRVSARRLTQSWQNVPHVTQHDAADVTELEAFRASRKQAAAERGLKLSPLLFVMKAVVIALRELPDFRSSLDASGEQLVVKDYYHLGIAVDTEEGLVVPVVRDVDTKGIFALAEELAALAARARARRLGPAEMQGACFTISSLGGIGGTHFTPIVNAPEVAILGLSKLEIVGRWSAGLDVTAESGRFEPRISLPLSLSYDHRVIDGAVAARFTSRLATLLSHPDHLLL